MQGKIQQLHLNSVSYSNEFSVFLIFGGTNPSRRWAMCCVRSVVVSPAGPTCQQLSKFSKNTAEICGLCAHCNCQSCRTHLSATKQIQQNTRGNRNWTCDTSKWSASVQPAALRVYLCQVLIFSFCCSIVLVFFKQKKWLHWWSNRTPLARHEHGLPLLRMVLCVEDW